MAVLAGLSFALTGVAQNQGAAFALGTTAQIDVPVSPFLVPTNGITVEAWITYDESTVPVGVGDQYPSILRHTGTSGGESYLMRVDALSANNRSLNFTVNLGGLVSVSYPFTAGEFANWTHVAGTFDGQAVNLLVNGVQVATVPATGTIVDGGGGLAIGNGGDGTFTTETTWNGNIDEVRIWPYGRSDAEVMETMTQTLFAVPNGLTFNLDGDGVDTSQGLVGVPTAAVSFLPGTMLPALGLGGANFGAGSTTCSNLLGAGLGSSSRAGNTDFALACFDASPNAPGGVLLAGASLPGPLPLLGVDLWVNPGTLLPTVPSVMSDASGFARLPLSLGTSTTVGLSLACQFIFIDATCGSAGLVATQGVQFTVQ